MIKEFYYEFMRNISELKKYKFNLIFANLQIFIFAYFITSYLYVNNRNTIFLLLLIWYFSTHGISNPTYILEEEILDRTIINIIQSNTGIFKVVVFRCLNTIVMDLVKAIPLFTLLFYIGNFSNEIFSYFFIKIFVIFIAIFSSYFLGIFLASFVFEFKRFSNFISLTYYYILFFGGITVSIEHKFIYVITKLVFPYITARNIFENLDKNVIYINDFIFLIAQMILFAIISYNVFRYILNRSIEKGDLYGI